MCYAKSSFVLPRFAGAALTFAALLVSPHPHVARAIVQAAPSPIRPQGLVWSVEQAHDPQNAFPAAVGNVVLAFDTLGSPHVLLAQACAGPGNCPSGEWYDAQRDEDGWRLSGPIGVSETIGILAAAFSASNSLHVVYQKPSAGSLSNTALIYAVQTGSGWQTETITDTGDSPSLVLDSLGQPHIAFRGAQGLHYARRTPSGWHHELVAQSDALKSNGYPALALDAGNRPAIWTSVYRLSIGGADTSFAFAQKTSSGWGIQDVPLVITGAGVPRLYLDAQGDPHAVFARTQPSTTSRWITQMEHVWRAGGMWQWERASVTPSDQAQLTNASIAIDPGGRAAIAFNDLAGEYFGLHLAQLMPGLRFRLQASPTDNVSAGAAVTHTMTLSASMPWEGRVMIPVPVGTQWISDSLTSTLSPAPVFSPTANAIVWQGIAPTNTMGTIGYAIAPTTTLVEASDAMNANAVAPPFVSTAKLSWPGYAYGVTRKVIINGLVIHLPLSVR
jgi:hypothetical protein